jgi:purine-nucleoside phosphorylase
MSTVPEALAARQAGVRVTALSCITNAAAGLGTGDISHQEVLDMAARVRQTGGRLLAEFIRLYGKNQ